jgi:hypothetical protein
MQMERFSAWKRRFEEQNLADLHLLVQRLGGAAVLRDDEAFETTGLPCASTATASPSTTTEAALIFEMRFTSGANRLVKSFAFRE